MPVEVRRQSTEPLLEVRGLYKAFHDVGAVEGVDLDLGRDEVLALVGPSGCGKSTILRTIAGLVSADSGMIRLGGDVVEDGRRRLAPERRSAGLVFQEHALFPHLSVAENVAFGLRDLSRREIAETVSEMLAMVDLVGLDKRYPHELSGGERQRVALARALAPKPMVMLLDEPFAALDHNLRVQLRLDVRAVLRKTSTPAIFVTHDQSEALSIGDRLAVMNKGQIIQRGTPEEVFHQPASVFVGGFMGQASFLDITVDSGEASTELGPVDLAGGAAESCSVMVRPQDVEFSPQPDGSARVVGVEYHGASWIVTAETSGGERVRVLRSHLEPASIGERGAVTLVPGHRQVVVLK